MCSAKPKARDGGDSEWEEEKKARYSLCTCFIARVLGFWGHLKNTYLAIKNDLKTLKPMQKNVMCNQI